MLRSPIQVLTGPDVMMKVSKKIYINHLDMYL
jgi:hypothetical protein